MNTELEENIESALSSNPELRDKILDLVIDRDAIWQKRLEEKVERDVLKGARRRVIETIKEEERKRLIYKIHAVPTEVFMDGDEPTDYKKVDDIMKVI